MADFVAVLKKTLDGLTETSPQMREKVYEKARLTIAGKLAAMSPTPPPSVIDRQKRALEEAIASIEKEFAPPKPAAMDPLTELENVFASLKNPDPLGILKPATPRPPVEPAPPVRRDVEPVRTEPTPAPAPASAALPPMVSKPAPAALPPLPAGLTQQPPKPVSPPKAPANDTVELDLGPDDELDFNDDPAEAETIAADRQPRRQRSFAKPLVAVLGLAIVAGGAYGIWLNRTAFGDMLGMGGTEVAKVDPAPAAPEPAAVPAPEAEAPAPVEEAKPADPAPAPAEPPAAAEEPKFTQRLNADGTEVDAGAAGGEPGIGEGTSVAAVTQPGTPPVTDPAIAAAEPPPAPPATDAAPAAPAAPAPAGTEQGVPVAQRAIFYEERTNVAEASAEPGSIVWSLVQESPGGDLPPEAAIRAEATIPGKDIQLRMTIRRNADKTLPASHIVEVIFLTPEGFEGGGIDNVLRVSMKGSEQEAGSPLIGIPAKIADGFFLIALNDSKPEIDANLTLLRRQSWIDVPVQYKSGRRALFTMEKGIPGAKVFDEAIKAWTAAAPTGSTPG